jgi:hypothetical protein
MCYAMSAWLHNRVISGLRWEERRGDWLVSTKGVGVSKETLRVDAENLVKLANDWLSGVVWELPQPSVAAQGFDHPQEIPEYPDPASSAVAAGTGDWFSRVQAWAAHRNAEGGKIRDGYVHAAGAFGAQDVAPRSQIPDGPGTGGPPPGFPA